MIKIKCETPDNLFKFYNETIEINQKRKKIEKYGNVSIFNQLIKISLYILISVIYIVILMNLNINKILCYIITSTLIFFLISLVVYIINFIVSYKNMKKNGIKCTITINKKSIITKTEKYKIEMNLNEISSIIIGKYSINIFLPNSNICLRTSSAYAEQIVNSIKEHKEDIRVIKLNND